MAKKIIGAGALFPENAESAFMRMTLVQYNNMLARVKSKGFYGLPFDRHGFREYVLKALGGHYDGFVRCRYCTGFFALGEVAVDHAAPLSRGGGVDLDNLDLPCKPCNSRKGSMKPQEYLDLLDFLDSRIPLAKTDVLRRLEMSVQVAAGAAANAPTIAELKKSGDWQRVQKARRQAKRDRQAGLGMF